MNDLNELVNSTLSLYEYKFFIDDTDLSEDVIEDIVKLNKEFNNKISQCYKTILLTNEPLIRKIIMKITSLKDKYKYSSSKDSLTGKEYNFTIKRFNNIIQEKYFEISNYIEKIDIVSFSSDKSFMDIISSELNKSLCSYIEDIKMHFYDTRLKRNEIQSEETITLYNSAIIENLIHTEKVVNEIINTIDLIKNKIDYYCLFINKIRNFDEHFLRKLSSSTKYFLGEANKDYVTIASKSIITQKLYCDIIIDFYSVLNFEMSDFLKKIQDYLNQF